MIWTEARTPSAGRRASPGRNTPEGPSMWRKEAEVDSGFVYPLLRELAWRRDDRWRGRSQGGDAGQEAADGAGDLRGHSCSFVRVWGKTTTYGRYGHTAEFSGVGLLL